ncbi:MAG: SH3 domain-containing protein [Candidatus Omnitrophica bacterium]|nr:SH3 domain-containing protein [Candidatus Omnitrophota bacterium]
MKLSFCARFFLCAVTCLFFSLNSSYASEGKLQGGAFTGIVSGERVNVRAADNTSSEVICQLNKGEEIGVLGLRGKWYKIELPKKALVYVAKSTVSKKDGQGIISEDKTNIRTAATVSSTVIGRLNKGAAVKIRKGYLDWYEIEAPKGSYGWVSSDYIRQSGAEILKPVPLSERLALLDATYSAELKKPLREIELKWILEGYQKLAAENKGTPEEKEALFKAEEIKLKMAEIGHLKAKEEYDAKIKNISSPRPGETPIVSGLVSNVGKVHGRLSQFKIVKDGKSLGYLTSSKVDFNRYINLPVNVWGVKKDVNGTALYEADAVQIIE